MKIGILTSGGDCPGINATIRGVCKTAINHYGMEVFGIHSGFRGLLDNDIIPLTDKDLTGLLNMGGTILGTSREKPFKKRSTSSQNKPALMLKTIQEMQLDCIVCIGGSCFVIHSQILQLIQPDLIFDQQTTDLVHEENFDHISF